MKAFELFGLYESFDRLMDGNDFTPVVKVAIGREMIDSLPPQQFCTATPATFGAVYAAMVARVAAMEKSIEPVREEAVAQEGKEATQATTQAGQAKANGRKRAG